MTDAVTARARELLERLAMRQSGNSPVADLRAAQLIAREGALLLEIARELSESAYADLGRFAAEVVEEAAQAPDPRRAAEQVAEGFLRLHEG
ncbi:MAG: hypothetical protein SF070_11485 [Gemmatimonadota bacterium]|nr:hypothetical protein [Gemmatimonadota bacterium]